MAGYPKPRKYTPKNPRKYKGDSTNIVLRSSWETKLAIWADTNSSVVEWGSEEVIVPYISPLDQKTHRYFIDFFLVIRNKEGVMKRYLVEVKPESQTLPPTRGKKREKTFIAEVETWGVNSAKWRAATHFARTHNAEFIILTEKHLGIK